MQSRKNLEKSQSQTELLYFISYGICFLSLGLGVAALGPLLPFLAKNVGVSIARISFLFTAGSLGYLLGSAGGGRLYDRFKGHHLMLIALVLMMLSSVFIPIIYWFHLLIGAIFIFGLGQGALDVGGNVNLLWVFQDRVGPFMNALHFFFGVGALLSPIIIHTVMRWAGGAITWPYWVLAMLFTPGIIGLLLLKSPNNNEKENDDNLPQTADARLVALMIVLFFAYVGVETGFGGWIYTYAITVEVASHTAAAYLNSLFWGALTLGRLLSIPLAKRISPASLLIGNFTLAIIFFGLFLFKPTDSIVVWLSTAGIGLGLSSIFPTLLTLGETRMKITGQITGLFFIGSSLGGTVFPTILGQIFEYIGTYQIMLTLFLLVCAGLILLFLVILASDRVGEKIRQ